jgi:4a-hydroxytetrahydrobiopterin dehydratase
MTDGPMRRDEISTAVAAAGWRFLLGTVRTSVRVTSLRQAADLTARVVAVAEGTESLWLDVRADRVELALQSPVAAWVTATEVELADRISAAVTGLGLTTSPEVGTAVRSVQLIEVGIDAMDIAAVRPFWKAVLGYIDDPGGDGPENALIDPLRLGPAVWFQQMDAPRSQRNRIHLDLSVPHDEAPRRVVAALAAGGTLRTEAFAPSFWVLADPEGNEACVTTWQGRDESRDSGLQPA